MQFLCVMYAAQLGLLWVSSDYSAAYSEATQSPSLCLDRSLHAHAAESDLTTLRSKKRFPWEPMERLRIGMPSLASRCMRPFALV